MDRQFNTAQLGRQSPGIRIVDFLLALLRWLLIAGAALLTVTCLIQGAPLSAIAFAVAGGAFYYFAEPWFADDDAFNLTLVIYCGALTLMAAGAVGMVLNYPALEARVVEANRAQVQVDRARAIVVAENAAAADRPNHAEKAFEQIDLARREYPPLGADPTNYNAAITKAYHAWERAAETAYGSNWRSVWEGKHAGDPSVCPGLEITSGLPVAACAEVAASQGEIVPLDDLLMRCPSWDDPTGAIFNPHEPEACARRKKALAAARANRSTVGAINSTAVPDPDDFR